MTTKLNAKPRWTVEAIFPNEKEWSTQVVEADVAAPWTGGALFLFDHGETGARRNVLTLAPSQWRSCEPE